MLPASGYLVLAFHMDNPDACSCIVIWLTYGGKVYAAIFGEE